MKYKSKIFISMLIATVAIFVIMFYNTKTKAEDNINAIWKDIPVIKMNMKNGEKSYSISIMDVEKYHNGGDGVCLGLASGFRACRIALSALYSEGIPKRGDQFVVSGPHRGCPSDAITYITGARYGKGTTAFNGNLAYDKTIGDFNFIFVNMTTGKAVKLISKFKTPKEYSELREKSEANRNNIEIKNKFTQLSDSLARKVLTAPANEIFEVKPLVKFNWKEYKEKYLGGR